MVLLTWPMASMSPQRMGMRSTCANRFPSLTLALLSAAHALVVRARNPLHQVAVRDAGSGGVEFDPHRAVTLGPYTGRHVDLAEPPGRHAARAIRDNDVEPLVAQRAHGRIPGSVEGGRSGGDVVGTAGD